MQVERQVHSAKDVRERYQAVIRKMDKHIKKQKDGTLRLSVAPDKIGGDRAIVNDLLLSLEATNDMVRNNQIPEFALRSESSSEARSIQSLRMISDGEEPTDTSGSTGGGVGGSTGGGVTDFRMYWWGFEVYLNDAGTHELIKQLAIGAGGAAALLIALFGPPGAVVGALVGAALLIGAGIISIFDAAGGHDGVVFGHLWHPFVPPWIWAQ